MLTQPTVFDTLRFRLQAIQYETERQLVGEVNSLKWRQDLQQEFTSMKSGVRRDFIDAKNDLTEMLTVASTKIAENLPLSPITITSNQNDNVACTDLQRQIRDYEDDVRSDNFLYQLNQTLQERLPSAAHMIDYYQSRPKLEVYTIEKELHRMNYVVWTDTGKRLTTPEAISEYYYENKENRRPNNNSDNSISLLWRSANQSILGDVICYLTSSTGLIRPQLSGGTFATDCTITIDMSTSDEPFVRAECFLNVSIPTSTTTSTKSGPSRSCKEQDNEEEEGRQNMAGVVVSVYFSPIKHRFVAKVWHVSCGERLTELQLNDAIKAIQP